MHLIYSKNTDTYVYSVKVMTSQKFTINYINVKNKQILSNHGNIYCFFKLKIIHCYERVACVILNFAI